MTDIGMKKKNVHSFSSNSHFLLYILPGEHVRVNRWPGVPIEGSGMFEGLLYENNHFSIILNLLRLEGIGDGAEDGSTRTRVTKEREEMRAAVLNRGLED